MLTAEGNAMGWKTLAAALATVGLAIAVATALHGPDEPPEPGVAAGPSITSVPPRVPYEPPQPGHTVRYYLNTHCGIDEMHIGDTYYEVETPLTGVTRAPSGWDHPHQPGDVTIVSETRAVFRDDKGHEVWFRARPGATDFKRICM